MSVNRLGRTNQFSLKQKKDDFDLQRRKANGAIHYKEPKTLLAEKEEHPACRGINRLQEHFCPEPRERLDLVGLLLDMVEDNDQELEQVLGHLEEKPTDLERYVYLIRLCDRNERLFHKVMMSDRIRFLLASNWRKELLEISLDLRSLARVITDRRAQFGDR